MNPIHAAGHDGEFGPLADAPRDGTLVTLRFRDPATPDDEPEDRAVRFETGHAKAPQWRFADTLDVLLDRNADGWTWAPADAATLDWAGGRVAEMDAARDADLLHDATKARNKLPWQVALAKAGQDRNRDAA
jgi:hypothetical protein